MTTNAIKVTGLHKAYGHIKALNGINISVQEGEIFGLLGANGAGKSTLINLLIGTLASDSGSIEVLGFDPRKQRRQLRPQVGYMPQHQALYEDLSARDNIRFLPALNQLTI